MTKRFFQLEEKLELDKETTCKIFRHCGCIKFEIRFTIYINPNFNTLKNKELVDRAGYKALRKVNCLIENHFDDMTITHISHLATKSVSTKIYHPEIDIIFNDNENISKEELSREIANVFYSIFKEFGLEKTKPDKEQFVGTHTKHLIVETKAGEFVGEFSSVKEASKKLKLNENSIYRACQERIPLFGYKINYAE